MVEIENLSLSYGNSPKVLKKHFFRCKKKANVYYLLGKVVAENLQL